MFGNSATVPKIKAALHSFFSSKKRIPAERESIEIRADRYAKQSGLAVIVPELTEIMEYWPHWAKRPDAADWVPAWVSELDGGDDKQDGKWIQWKTGDELFRITHKQTMGMGGDEYREYRVHADDREVIVFAAHATNGGYGPWQYAFVSSLIVGPWVANLLEFHGHAKTAAAAISARSAAENKRASAARFDLGD